MVFAAGIACGMLLFVRLIRMCLERFRSQTIYAIIGMMLGSLFSITQGPLTLSEPQPAMSLDTFSIAFFLIGGAVVAGSSCSGRAWRNPPRANALRRPHRTAATRHGSRCREARRFAMLARRLDSFAQTREIIVIGMARRFVEVLDELMHARSLLGLGLGGLRVAGANAGGMRPWHMNVPAIRADSADAPPRAP